MKTMKTMIIALFTLMPAFLLSACGADDSDKDKCITTEDCSSGYSCNLERTEDGKKAQVGKCMKASEDGFFLCSRDNPCPAGQWCFNGVCAPGCMTDQDCATNQYCDTKVDLPNNQLGTHMCVNKEVPGCVSDGDCAEAQECVMGMCSAAQAEQQCTPRPDGQDGCDEYSVCLDLGEVDQENNTCVSFPPCPQDGECPVGQIGSICNNEEIIPDKARICLPGLCETEENCPSGFKCLMLRSNLGACSDGTLGMPCLTSADCAADLACAGAGAGAPGYCMPGIVQTDCEDAGGTCIDAMSQCPAGTQIDGTKQCQAMTDICCM